ncbi:transcription factor Tfb4 [Entophlyctis helioformis]|nr:transcription factor Tfb4 [Entophlyctis helioformis]
MVGQDGPYPAHAEAQQQASRGAALLQRTIDQLLVLVNAHLALRHSNRLAVITSTPSRSEIIYPAPAAPATTAPAAPAHASAQPAADQDVPMEDAARSAAAAHPKKPANVYKQFFDVDNHVVKRLKQLAMDESANSDSQGVRPSRLAGALSLALSYINKARSVSGPDLQSRILVVSVSPDGPGQYIPIMNCIFAAQKQGTPIDVCRLVKGGSVFLPQAAHITGGIYLEALQLEHLIQHLLHVFLPDTETRKMLCLSGNDEIDFRASCFCHKRNVDVGYVCSVCLSIFCSVRPECSTCQTKFIPSATPLS